MLAATFVVLAGSLLSTFAVDAIERQMQELDPSQPRLDVSLANLGVGGVVAALGVLVFLLAAVVFLVGSARARARGALAEQPSRAVASIATIGIALALLYMLVLPTGPAERLLADATQSGASGVQVFTFNGTLQGAAAAPNAPQDVWPVPIQGTAGKVQMRVLSGGGPAPLSPNATGVLEAGDGRGGWSEVGRASGPDGRLVAAARDYGGGMRVRVVLSDGSIGQAQYVVAVSFAPTG
jgi:hypothetical protein